MSIKSEIITVFCTYNTLCIFQTLVPIIVFQVDEGIFRDDESRDKVALFRLLSQSMSLHVKFSLLPPSQLPPESPPPKQHNPLRAAPPPHHRVLSGLRPWPCVSSLVFLTRQPAVNVIGVLVGSVSQDGVWRRSSGAAQRRGPRPLPWSEPAPLGVTADYCPEAWHLPWPVQQDLLGCN